MKNNHNEYKTSENVLLMVVGVAGSGKTSLATMLARKLTNGVFLSKDSIQDKFSMSARSGSEVYEIIQGPTFDILVEFADVQLSHGKTPIIEGPFSRNFRLEGKYADWVAHFRDVAEKHNAKLLIIRCRPPSAQELKERLRKRGFERDVDKLRNWEEWSALEPEDFPITHDEVYDLITDKPTEELADYVLEKIVKAFRV